MLRARHWGASVNTASVFMQWLNRGLSVESRMIGPIPEGPHETERDKEWTLDLGMGGQG